MYKCDAYRFFELKFGHIVDHGLYTLNCFIDGEGGVVVVFEMDEEYGRQELGNVEVDGVLPIHVEAQPIVIAAFKVIVEGVKHRGVVDAFADGLLVIDDDVDADGGCDVLAWDPRTVLVVVAFLDAKAALVGEFLVHHEGDLASHGAHENLETLVLGLV